MNKVPGTKGDQGFELFSGGPVMVFRWLAQPGWPVEFVSGNISAFGYSEDDFYSGRVAYSDLIHPEDLARIAAEVQQNSESGLESFEQDYRLRTAWGEYRWLYDFTRVIRNEAGLVTHFHGYILDITERKTLEAKLLQSQKLDSLGRLAGGIAHDFNNLLTVIISSLDLLRPGFPVTGSAAQHLDRASDAALRGASITKKLLTFARQPLPVSDVENLNSLVLDLKLLLEATLGETLRTHYEMAAEALSVRIDPGQFQQLLLNLAINARDAMPSGGTLRISTARVEAAMCKTPTHTDSPAAYALLKVSDSGCGISPSSLEHIFDPFYSTREPGSGTGLGLSICHGIVTSLKGHIEVTSALGEGSTFSVYLPLSEEAPQADRARPLPAQLERLAGRVLYVEDEDLLRDVTGHVLQNAGLEMLVAANGRQALKLLRDKALRPDLLITDIVMPEMGGIELERKLRDEYPGLPVIFVSGYTEDERLQAELTRANVRFMAKPFRPSELVRVAGEMLASCPA